MVDQKEEKSINQALHDEKETTSSLKPLIIFLTSTIGVFLLLYLSFKYTSAGLFMFIFLPLGFAYIIAPGIGVLGVIIYFVSLTIFIILIIGSITANGVKNKMINLALFVFWFLLNAHGCQSMPRIN